MIYIHVSDQPGIGWKICCSSSCCSFSQERAWEENWDQGGLPVAISMMVQPTDQMSAVLPCPVCLITSGAIQ